jgi:hypothetical protein
MVPALSAFGTYDELTYFTFSQDPLKDDKFLGRNSAPQSDLSILNNCSKPMVPYVSSIDEMTFNPCQWTQVAVSRSMPEPMM